MAKKNYNLYFCFVDGEAFIYHRDIQKYFPINTENLYSILFEHAKNYINTCTQRPNMLQIWRVLTDYFKADTFSTYYTKKTRSFEHSFETRFTKDITEFIDTKFNRGKTDEERAKIRKYRNETIQKFAVPDSVLAANRYKFKKRKNGRRFYRN